MKRNLFICVIILCTFLQVNAQWSGTDPLTTSSSVGIGTQSPGSYKLNVSGYFNANGFQSLPTYPYTVTVVDGADAGDIILQAGSTSSFVSLINIGGRSYGTPGIQFSTRSMERMRISDDGNVGIGTPVPLGKLDIFSSTANDVLLSFPRSSNSTVKACWFSVDGNDNSVFTTTNGHINFRTNWNDGAPLSTLFLKSDGSVGIGTTSPGYKLTLIGGSEVGSRFIVAGTYAPVQFSGDAGTTIGGINAYNGVVVLGRGTATGVYSDININSTGNVGIGTITPNGKLDVYGGLKVGATSDLTPIAGKEIVISPISGTTAGIFFQHNGVNSVFIKSDGATQYTTFGANAGTFLSINNTNGNVGIGTTTPQNALEVNGTIKAREIKASLDGWPDFVFDKDYKLLSLNDVENYINTNKKLPEIPSSKEITTDGVKLGEMNALLLKKVEELTLYVIGQNKKIDNQNEMIQSLDKKIEKLESEKTNKF